jgi:hypothetical protein
MSVRFIPTKVHGAVDHGLAAVLIAAPEIFRLRDDSPEGLIARVVGGMETIYANITDYEMSVEKVVPMPVHLALDGINGAALALIPQFTGARKRGITHWVPHLGIGVFEIGMALFTKTQPPRRRNKSAALNGAKKAAKIGLGAKLVQAVS